MQADHHRLPQWTFRLIIFNFEECPAYFVSFPPPPFHFPPSLQQDTEPSRAGLVWDRDGGSFVSLFDFFNQRKTALGRPIGAERSPLLFIGNLIASSIPIHLFYTSECVLVVFIASLRCDTQINIYRDIPLTDTCTYDNLRKDVMCNNSG